MTSARDDHLFSPGPKRILALDGGGIRGVLTLQYLRRIESMLVERYDDADFRLSDYFDLIGGTSTGAIIAAGLALGWKVERLATLYNELGDKVFDAKFYRRGIFAPKFSAKTLKKQLKVHFGDIRLGDDELKTGLMVVLKRMDTNSTWILSNNPRGRYYNQRKTGIAIANKEFLLRNVVRASTAAPTYFEPERFEVAPGVEAEFVDGGVSPFNNPSLPLLMMATANAYGIKWQTGADKILMISCGTGAFETSIAESDGAWDYTTTKIASRTEVGPGVAALATVLDDTGALNETMLQWLSHSPNGRQIDRELGNLADDMPAGHHLLTYVRYQSWLDQDWLSTELGLPYSAKKIKRLRKMEKPENMKELIKIGKKSAQRFIEASHLPPVFDVQAS